jgi:hypothetical protein
MKQKELKQLHIIYKVFERALTQRETVSGE